jgi:GNAT superfamily N-acetyltransferase
MTQPLRFIHRSGKEISPYIHRLARLRIDVFREYPYLYDGTPNYEENYLNTYVQSSESIAIMVFDGDHLVGASTGLPLTDETDEFKKPFTDQGLNIKRVFYCGESILMPDYRGRGIYSTFMQNREHFARKLNRFDTICFCAVQRPVDHPLRPPDYHTLDPVWRKYGYEKKPELAAKYRWKDISDQEETYKKMVFWVKSLD